MCCADKFCNGLVKTGFGDSEGDVISLLSQFDMINHIRQEGSLKTHVVLCIDSILYGVDIVQAIHRVYPGIASISIDFSNYFGSY